jgi:thymidylate synthase
MMTNIEHDYLRLLKDILDNGVEKQDRTGTGTRSVFGRQIRHKMSEGFPLLTTKKMPFKTIATELIWFLRGDTNIRFLVDNNCHIWDGDAYKAFETWYEHMSKTTPFEVPRKLTQEELIKAITLDKWHEERFGELGPIYGKQWRDWGSMYENNYILDTKTKRRPGIDQITNLINDLKTNPDSRRLMVNAWNVGEIDQMTLPPCHYGFQVYTRPTTREEKITNPGKYRAISLMWNQRSVDTFLGLPFNIASYALLLEIIAKEVDMIPDELIGNLGDVHLYSNHIDQAKEQITREPMKLPELWCLDEYHYLMDEELVGPIPFSEKIEKFRPDFFKVNNYQAHPHIKAPLSN